MKARVTSGLLGALLLVLVLVSDRIYLNIGIAIVAFIALTELYTAVGLVKKPLPMLLGLVISFAFTYAQAFDNALLSPLLYVFIVCLFLLYLSGRHELKLQDIALIFFLTIYLSFFLCSIVFVRKMPSGNFMVWLVFVCAFATDTFALLGGKLFGKRKLAPKISPNKTVEGSISGVVGTVVSVWVYCWVLQRFFALTPHYGRAIVLAVAGSCMAQLGDLAASCIKREHHIKNYGNIMPGHGGVMDRFDSVLFVAPLVYYFLMLFPLV